MSGRSGYVRVEQAMRSRQQSHRKELHVQDQDQVDSLTTDLILSKFSCFSEYKSQSNPFYSNPSINFHHDVHLHPKLRYTLALQSQISLKNLLPPVERSSFRAKMDEKCVKCRNKIRKVFGMKGEEDQLGNLKLNQHDKRNSYSFDSLYDQTLSSPGKLLDNPLIRQKHCPRLSAAPIPALKVQLRRWSGYGRPDEPWEKLRKDPELFDLNGDTLIYLCDPKVSLLYLPPSFRISSHIIEATKSTILIKMLNEGSIKKGNHFDALASYQIFFPAPLGLSKINALRHQLTTRNFFALLLTSSLVGQTMYQALFDLRDRLEEYMPDIDAAGMIIDWIKSRNIDDPRCNPSTALSLLAWAEGDGVRWKEGWKEAFCHIVGMRALDHDKKFEILPEYRFLSPITKTLLDRFSINTQILVQDCEYRLESFDFNDMWDVSHQRTSTGRSAFDRFRKFLVQHYQKIYGKWPPCFSDDREQWLTRSVSKRLNLDFAALYDYLVNRNVCWDYMEGRVSRKWNMKCTENCLFDPDTKQLPITDILITFDDNMGYPHIPHPYCLTPEPDKITPRKMAKKSQRQENIMLERQAAIAYQNSTNVYLLGAELVTNDLVDAYIQFEKGDRFADNDPYNSRRGRWILIYGVLQVLASISVDVPHLCFTEDVDYHLQCSLRGTPPWAGADQNQPEAEHEKSHCWLVPDRWRPLQPIIMNRHIDQRSCTPCLDSKLDVISEYSNAPHSSTSSQISGSELFSTESSPRRIFHVSSDLSSPMSQKYIDKRSTHEFLESYVLDPSKSPQNYKQKSSKDGVVFSPTSTRTQMIDLTPDEDQISFYGKHLKISAPMRTSATDKNCTALKVRSIVNHPNFQNWENGENFI